MKKHLLLYLSIAILFSTGCQKDKDQFVPYPLDGEINNMIEELLDDPISLQVNTQTDQFIKIDKTFSLKTYDQSFINTDQEILNIDWTNARNSIQMELLNLPHYTSNNFLSPSFTFNLSSSEAVNINKDQALELFIESDLVEDQYLFHLSSEGWYELDMSNMIATEWADEDGFAKSGYMVTVEQLGWYVIASKVDLTVGPSSNLCLELEGQYTQTNSKSMILLEKDVIIPISRSINQGLYCSTMNIAVDETVRVISMSNIREGEYEFFYLETQMENGLIVAPVLESKSIEEIKIILENI